MMTLDFFGWQVFLLAVLLGFGWQLGKLLFFFVAGFTAQALGWKKDDKSLL